MASTTFVDQVTVIEAAWLNAVDAITYDVFNGATSAALARTALGLAIADSVIFGTVTATTFTGTLSTVAQPNITSLGTIVSLVATTADINAGTVDATIGATTPAPLTCTTFTSTGIDDNSTSTAITIDSSENTTFNGNVYDSSGDALKVGGNGIYNGKMTISQRGDYTSATAAAHVSYYIDRWKTILAGGVITANIQDMVGSYKITAVAASTANASLGFRQEVEKFDYYDNKTVTFSALVTSNSSNVRIAIYNGSAYVGISSPHTGDGTEQLLTTTVTMGANTSLFPAVYITDASFTNTTTIVAGEYIQIADARLDLGEHRLSGDREYAAEEGLCKRYFRKQDFYVPATTAQTLGIIGMRATPTITGGGTGFTSTGTTEDVLIAYQTTGGIQTLELASEL